jgi:hypothetical protein
VWHWGRYRQLRPNQFAGCGCIKRAKDLVVAIKVGWSVFRQTEPGAGRRIAASDLMPPKKRLELHQKRQAALNRLLPRKAV